jgi:serine/threonine protein kinase
MQGFIHLNIKPSNVIIDMRDRVYLSPLSRQPSYYDRLKENWEKLEREDRSYIVPEFFDRGVPNISLPLCDMYLLGLLGYHMITGDYPFPEIHTASASPGALRQFQPLKINDPTCPETLQAVVVKMASPYVDERFATLREAMDHLEQFRDEALSQARDSYCRIVSAGREENVFRQFYETFRKNIKSTAARERFERMGDEEWHRQHELLKEAIVMLLAYREFDAPTNNREPREPTVLSHIRRKHSSFAIPHDDYVRFGKLLAETLAANDPASCDSAIIGDDIRRSWKRTIEPGLAYMERSVQ